MQKIESTMLAFCFMTLGLYLSLLGFHAIDNAWNLQILINAYPDDGWTDCSAISCEMPNQIYIKGCMMMFIGIFSFGLGCYFLGKSSLPNLGKSKPNPKE
jgi:hypothetical protein